MAMPMGYAYNSSKAALAHFARCSALEMAPKGVRINIVSPGYVLTPAVLPLLAPDMSPDDKEG